MADSFEDLRRQVLQFSQERGWESVATAKDLTIALMVEAAELQEVLLWTDPNDEATILKDRYDQLQEEIADVLIYCIRLADRAGIDPVEAIARKQKANAERFA